MKTIHTRLWHTLPHTQETLTLSPSICPRDTNINRHTAARGQHLPLTCTEKPLLSPHINQAPSATHWNALLKPLASHTNTQIWGAHSLSFFLYTIQSLENLSYILLALRSSIDIYSFFPNLPCLRHTHSCSLSPSGASVIGRPNKHPTIFLSLPKPFHAVGRTDLARMWPLSLGEAGHSVRPNTPHTSWHDKIYIKKTMTVELDLPRQYCMTVRGSRCLLWQK